MRSASTTPPSSLGSVVTSSSPYLGESEVDLSHHNTVSDGWFSVAVRAGTGERGQYCNPVPENDTFRLRRRYFPLPESVCAARDSGNLFRNGSVVLPMRHETVGTIRSLLESSLDEADDSEIRFKLRTALQLLVAHEEDIHRLEEAAATDSDLRERLQELGYLEGVPSDF